MERFGHILRWCIEHSKSWGIPTIVGTVAATGTWFLARRKEWKEARQAKADSVVDSKILQTLQDRKLWCGPRRVMTGAGDPGVRSTEIAEAFSLDREVVIDSLRRLEVRGRVRSGDGNLDNPAPYWYIVQR